MHLQSLNQTQPLTVLYPQLLPLIKNISLKYTRESDVMDAVWTFIKQVRYRKLRKLTAYIYIKREPCICNWRVASEHKLHFMSQKTKEQNVS